MPRTVKVAVVGTGLAGLTAAHLLTKEREDDEVDFEVHLFEKAATIGMDSSSVSISTSAQSKGSVEWRIDVPMRSFQGGYYNNLIALYKSLGVKFRQADFSYSFSSLSFGSKRASGAAERSITTTMIYNGGSGRAGVGKPSMLDAPPPKSSTTGLGSFLPRLSSTGLFLYLTLQLVLCYLITLYHSLPVWRPTDIPEITFAEWTARTTPRSYLARLCRLDVAWKEYVQTVLIPLVSAVCTSPAEDVMNHPIEEVLDYVWLTFGTHHYVVIGGVRKVVEALTANVKHQHLSSPIVSIKPDPSDAACVTIVCLSNGELTEYSGFHHIVMATQASGAATILTSYLDSISSDSTQGTDTLEQLISSLQAFEYRPSVVINHTDGTLLPDNSRDARDLNLITLAQDSPKPSQPATEVAPFCVTPSYTMATHVLPRPAGYPASQPTVYQSTNPIIAPDVNKILSAATLERAIVTTKSKKALEGLCVSGEKKWWQVPYHARTHLGPLQGASASGEKGKGGPAIWICGSYAHLGIPLLEGCVVSARNVVEEGIFAREGVRMKEAAW